MTPSHALAALGAMTGREVVRFVQQRGRLISALVRPLLWLIVVAAGFQNVFGISIIPPYQTYTPYQEYVLPGLTGMVLLFHGMQSSLSMVYDREMGMMRLLLTAPLPRWFLLLAKLMAGTLLSVAQVYAFLAAGYLLGVGFPPGGYLLALPAVFVSGLMLGALGLLLSVYIRQLENFAGTMNFVIFPMFFISSALYPLWRLRESAAEAIYWLALTNPFSHAVELVRFAAYGQFNPISAGVTAGCGLAFFLVAVVGYDPQRGLIRRKGGG
ncbi:MAG: ABC transporter permease [Inquilinus sp.]|nr:ABC transporter permease [Inquilinus sp.]